MARIPESCHGMLIHHMAKTQVAAVHVPGAHYKGVPAFQRGYGDRQVPIAVTRGGPSCIYTPLPLRGWKCNFLAMGEPTFLWYDGCTFGHMKVGEHHTSLKDTVQNVLLKMFSGAEPSPSQHL